MLIKIVQNGIESDWFQLTKKAHRELIKKKPEAAVYISRIFTRNLQMPGG